MEKDLISAMDAFFKDARISLYGAISIDCCPVIRPDLLDRTVPGAKTVLLYAVPYFTGDTKDRNVSLYAVSKDYHLFLKDLGLRLISLLSSTHPDGRFAAFVDHSPIDERISAAKAGLGVIGDNSLLITKDYGSFVFIGEVLADLPPEALGAKQPSDIRGCLHCGACLKACPAKGNPCASGISQKKGELTENEQEMVLKTGLVWGCDNCQTVCPLNKNIQKTPIPFFYKDRIEHLDKEILETLHGKEFKSYAFSWRGKQPLLRNIALFEEKNIAQENKT